jgi:hypothetical protein
VDTIIMYNLVIEHTISSENASLLQALFQYIDQFSLSEASCTPGRPLVSKNRYGKVFFSIPSLRKLVGLLK